MLGPARTERVTGEAGCRSDVRETRARTAATTALKMGCIGRGQGGLQGEEGRGRGGREEARTERRQHRAERARAPTSSTITTQTRRRHACTIPPQPHRLALSVPPQPACSERADVGAPVRLQRVILRLLLPKRRAI